MTATAHKQELATTNRQFLERLFATLSHEGWGQGFLDALHDDVVFNAMGVSPIAGRYEGKQTYITQVLERLHARIARRPQLSPIMIMTEADMACARFQSREGVGINGADFSMDYCWVFRIRDEKISEIWGYYDTGKMIALFDDSYVPQEGRIKPPQKH
ncbi:nuclear transport factor 2 family protein [Thalassospira marina]|uniref:nuclear transport factor 2 family protein n=1 Tax=Thalassospira marina TaxID=2048283 RepID=UPI000DF25208|nr:nuclear transport factor 2 family protein [Thalassospira marina]